MYNANDYYSLLSRRCVSANQFLATDNSESETLVFMSRLLTGRDKNGEDNEVRWLREIVAFSTTSGGTLYVGVNDKSHEIEPLSHEEAEAQIRLVYEKIEERVEPEIRISVREIPVEGTHPLRYVLAFDVSRSPILPVFLRAGGIPVCYIRQFGRCKPANSEQIRNMVLYSEKTIYDRRFTDEIYRREDFSFLFETFKRRTGSEELTEKNLIKMGFMDEDGRLSKGALLFRDDCVDPITTIKTSVFPGTDRGGNVYGDGRKIVGNLPSLIDQACDFVKSHSLSGFEKTANGRREFDSYPPRSVLEGIANAMVHKNYFLTGAFVEINLYVDRLEIVSPGSFLGGKNLKKEKDLSSIRPKARNAMISALLSELGYIEGSGSGFEKIEDEYLGADEAHLPYVSCDEDSFLLCLPNLSYSKGVIGEDNPYPEIRLPSMVASSYDEAILSCCYFKARSIAEIASYLDVAVSTHLRNDILNVLVEKGLLIKSRVGKTFFYQSNRMALANMFALK